MFSAPEEGTSVCQNVERLALINNHTGYNSEYLFFIMTNSRLSHSFNNYNICRLWFKLDLGVMQSLHLYFKTCINLKILKIDNYNK